MKPFQFVHSLCWFGALSLVGYPSVQSNEISNPVQSEATIARLRDLKRPATTVKEWLAQVEAATVTVTGVTLERTEAGLDITLETADGKPLQVDATKFKAEGNSLIADIPNAVLALPNAQAFSADNPTEGIANVRVTQVDAANIRVTVAGKNALPTEEVTLKTAGLAYSLNPEGETPEEELVVRGAGQRGYRVPNSSTVTKTDTPLRDIPQSIQIVPQQVLQDRGINTVGDALETVSSITQRDATGSIFGDLFTVRGFLIQSGITSNIFRDGLPYVIPGKLNTDDIEQVEVLKGSASILFGAGQPGGVINLVSKKPLLNPYYGAEFSVGSFDTYRAAIDFSGLLNEQKTSGYRLNLGYEKYDSFRDFVNGDRISISPVVSAMLGANTKLSVYARLSTEKKTADEGIPVIGDRIPDVPRSRFLGEDFAEIQSTTFNTGYTLEHKLSQAWTLRHNSQYLFFEFDRYYPILDGIDEATGDISRTAYATEGKYHRLTTGADVVGKFSTGSIQHTLLLGAEFRYGAENPAFQFSTAYDSINLFAPTYTRRPYNREFEFFRDDNFSTFAVYLQDQIALSSHLKLVAGVRYDTARQFRTTQDLGFERAEFRQTDSAWSPRVGIVYQPISALSLYASYARSFAPSFGTRRNLDEATFEPETGRQFEVGLKADLSDRLSLTIAAYDLRAYTNAFVSRDNFFPVGNRLSEVPYNQASLWTTYEVQQGSLKGLGLGVGLFYVGDQQGDLINSYELPGYFRTDALLYYKRNNWKAQLNFRNLFNREYFVSNFSDRFVSPSAPFSVSGSISIEF